MNAITNNPNAGVTALAGSVTVLAVWGAGAAGLSVPAEAASAVTTLAAAAILWVGRRGRKATLLGAPEIA